MSGIQNTLYAKFYPPAPPRSMSPLNAFLSGLIISCSIVVVLETEPTIAGPNRHMFVLLDTLFASVFIIEYFVRLWVIGCDPRYSGVIGRIKYMVTPMAVIDLLSIVPFFFVAFSNNFFLVRVARLFRMISLAKFSRYSRAMTEFAEVILSRKSELLLSLGIVFTVLLFASAVMYEVEGVAQPEAFGSIPRALWWGVETLTTVGYGDVYPRTLLGKICCGLTAIAGIGLIAMPTGVVAAAFTETFARMRDQNFDDE
ncbi:MAG: ion transporter [Candidatus Obscuribacterales bacterium]|nr:MAG: ion transporter [Candidatus Melainabacteria bacterium]